MDDFQVPFQLCAVLPFHRLARTQFKGIMLEALIDSRLPCLLFLGNPHVFDSAASGLGAPPKKMGHDRWIIKFVYSLVETANPGHHGPSYPEPVCSLDLAHRFCSPVTLRYFCLHGPPIVR